jgi:peptidoglycan/xylan/chitin deacetylase (PgdA/CDA1 family)
MPAAIPLLLKIVAGVSASRILPFLHALRLPQALSVLMYHSVINRQLPVRDWCFVPVASFEQQMLYLRRKFDVLHIDEALLENGERRKRPVACLTFDDGFEGVYEHAFPILERLELPATVFLVTDLVDSPSTVWFARLHQAIIETERSEVEFLGVRHSLATAAQRATASNTMQSQLKELRDDDFSAELDRLVASLVPDAGDRPLRPEFRMLKSDQIARMQRDDLVRFGAHTSSHQILSKTSAAHAESQITDSLSAIHLLVRRPSSCFAYPNGRSADFDDRDIAVLQQAGVRFAFTAEEGAVVSGLDPYRLPRYGIGDTDSQSRFVRTVHHGRPVARRPRQAAGVV